MVLYYGNQHKNTNNGQSAETPQVQGKIKYAHDFWGKAAYYGKPIPFTIQFVGGWQRNVIGSNLLTLPFSCIVGEFGPVYWCCQCRTQNAVSQPLVGHGIRVHSGHPDSFRQSGRHRLHPHPVVDRPGRRGLWVYRHVWRQIPCLRALRLTASPVSQLRDEAAE